MNHKLIAKQKSAGQQMLYALTNYFKTEEIYLAGGMLRDHYFDMPGDDFDFYMEVPETVDSEIVEAMVNSIDGFEDFKPLKQKNAYGSDYNSVVIDCVLEGTYRMTGWSDNFFAEDNRHKVQIILLKSNTMPPYAYLQDAFCCTLSKVWCQHQRDPVYHGDFLKSLFTNKISFDWRFANSINYDYIRKILKKYPNFDVDEKTLGNYKRELAKTGYY